MNKKKLLLLLIMPLFLSGCIKFGGAENDFGGVFKSLDKGGAFQQKALVATVKASVVSNGNVNVLSMSLDPLDHNAIYIGTVQDGLFYSYDGAESWNKVKYLENRQINAIAISPDNNCIIYASSGNNIFVSKDCNRTYKGIYNDPRAETIITKLAIDPKNTSVIFAGTSYGDLLKSEDGGTSWKNIGNFKTKITDILLAGDVYLTTTRELQRSSNGGANWENLTDNFKKDIKGGAMNIKRVLAIDGSAGNSIMIATEKDILVSQDKGNKWEILKLLTPKVKIYSIAVNSKNPNEIYYGTGTAFLKSSDGGKTWVSSKLPSTRLPYQMEIDPVSPNQTIIYMGMYKVE